MKPSLTTLALCLAIPACVSSNTAGDDDSSDDDGKADGSGTSGTYFECTGLGTNEATWLLLTSTSVGVTVEGSGTNSATKTTSTSTSKTYSNWKTDVFFGKTDTLVVPNSLLTSGSGKVDWYMSNVNPYWVGTCTKKSPTADQCLPLVEEIYPVDSTAKATYTTVTKGSSYTVNIPDSKVGAFAYKVSAKTTGPLCVIGTIANESCSAVVADKIASQARDDGSSSGSPYVATRATASGGYAWTGGVHDAESGEFAYDVTTDSDAANCKVTSIKSTN